MTEKTLHNSDISGTRVNVPDVNIVGNGDMFRLLCKASSQKEGWMKSTKAMEIPGVDCVVQVTTHQRNHDGTNAVAEAITLKEVMDDRRPPERIFGEPSANAVSGGVSGLL